MADIAMAPLAIIWNYSKKAIPGNEIRLHLFTVDQGGEGVEHKTEGFTAVLLGLRRATCMLACLELRKILLFRVLYSGPLFSETPMCVLCALMWSSSGYAKAIPAQASPQDSETVQTLNLTSCTGISEN